MAKKINIDSKVIQEWFNNHAEKVGMGVCGMVFLWMAWASISIKPYTRVQKDLEANISRTKSMVSNAHQEWDKKQDGIIVPSPVYEVQVNTAMKAIDEKPYEWLALFNVPLFEDKKRRGEPTLYPAIELQASFVQGAISLQKEGGTGGFLWNVVTAAIPIKQQLADYEKQFRNAITPFDSKRDEPHYVGFELERAEVLPGKEAAAPAWTKVDLDKAWDRSLEFNAQRPEVVETAAIEKFDPELYRIPSIIEPLPNKAYAHEPQLPMAAEGPRQQAAEAAPVAAGARRPRPGTAPAVVPQVDERKAVAKEERKFDFHLFRFCDFEVERGKSYIYRVRFMLENPNHNLEAFKLVKREWADPEFLVTPWSAASKPVTIPNDTAFHTVDVRPSISGQEALAKFMLERFWKPLGVFAGHTVGNFEGATQTRGFERGTRLHFMGQAGKIRKPGTATLEASNLDFPFDALLVGISGAEARGLRTKAPPELLVWWPDGRMEIKNFLYDNLAVDKLEHPVAPAVMAAAPGAAPAQNAPAAVAPAGAAPAAPTKTPDKKGPDLSGFLKAPPKADEKK